MHSASVVVVLVGLSELGGECAHTMRLDSCSSKSSTATTSEASGIDDGETILDLDIIPLHLFSCASTIEVLGLSKLVLSLSILDDGTVAGVC